MRSALLVKKRRFAFELGWRSIELTTLQFPPGPVDAKRGAVLARPPLQ